MFFIPLSKSLLNNWEHFYGLFPSIEMCACTIISYLKTPSAASAPLGRHSNPTKQTIFI